MYVHPDRSRAVRPCLGSMAAAADRLSALPDSLLQRILPFAPAREAAASTVLSRRWRPLWRRTGTVNLDTRPYPAHPDRFSYGDSSTPPYDAFFADAKAALDAFRGRGTSMTGGVKRLTLFLQHEAYAKPWWIREDQWVEEDRVGRVVLAHPAASGLEELRIDCENRHYREKASYYRPLLASLPCAATLRVLELVDCDLEPPSAVLDFPHLKDLRLRGCHVSEAQCKVVVDDAPASSRPFRLRLRCPKVTAFVLALTRIDRYGKFAADCSFELDMPNLQSFRYKGFPIKLSLRSPPPGLALVDIEVARHNYRHRGQEEFEPAWRMLRSFASTRVLKLRLSYIEDIVAGEEEEEEEQGRLPTFPNLKLLELDGQYEYKNSNTTAAAAMARLLRSFPAMSELRLRLNMERDREYERKFQGRDGYSFGESLGRFNELASTAFVQGGVQYSGDVSEFAALTDHCTCRCLRQSLRKVALQFRAKEINCFQVQLAKFLMENAMVLEEIHVHDKSQFWTDHLYNRVTRWRADSFRRRSLADTSGFHVYQLANPVEDPKDHQYIYDEV